MYDHAICSSPAELSKRVSELQTSQAIMLSKQGELNTRFGMNSIFFFFLHVVYVTRIKYVLLHVATDSHTYLNVLDESLYI